MADKKSKKWWIIGGVVALVVIGAIVWFASAKKKKELAVATPDPGTESGTPSVDCTTTSLTWKCPNDKDGNPKEYQNLPAARFAWQVDEFVRNMQAKKEGDEGWDWKQRILSDSRSNPLTAPQRLKLAGAIFHGLNKYSPDYALEFKIPAYWK